MSLHVTMLKALWKAHELLQKMDLNNVYEGERREIEGVILEAERYEEPVNG